MTGRDIRDLCLVGRYGWTDVEFAGIPDEILRDIVVGAWARTAPKKVAAGWQASR